MSSDLYFEGKKYISSRSAADTYGYTRDYIGQLIRSKKVDAKMIGRSWFVSEESLDAYQHSYSLSPKVSRLFPSATREVHVKQLEHKKSEKLPDQKPEPTREAFSKPASLQVGLSRDEEVDIFLPQLRKDRRSTICIPEKKIFSQPSRLADIPQKITAGVLSLSLVLGTYYMGDVAHLKSTEAFMNRLGSRAGESISRAYVSFAEGVRSLSDAYETAIENSGQALATTIGSAQTAEKGIERATVSLGSLLSLRTSQNKNTNIPLSDSGMSFALPSAKEAAEYVASGAKVVEKAVMNVGNLYLGLVTGAGEDLSDIASFTSAKAESDDSLAAIASADNLNLSGNLVEKIAISVHDGFDSLFRRGTSFIAELFASSPKVAEVVPVTPSKPIKIAVSSTPENNPVINVPVVATKISDKPESQSVYNTYNTYSGVSAGELDQKINLAKLSLEEQIQAALSTAKLAIENARSAHDRSSIRTTISGTTLTSVTLKDAIATGGLKLSGFDCTTYANGGNLTTDASGNISCSDDEGFATTSAEYFLAQNQGAAFSTTSASYFVSQNGGSAFSTSSASYFLAQNQGNAYSTTSADYWDSSKNRWSTTSASYFLSQNQGNAYSTTSANYWIGTKNLSAFSTTSVDYYVSQFRDFSLVNGYLAPTTTVGVILSASSTIGDGTQSGGLTVNGGATTTGSSYFAGSVGIGSQPLSSAKLGVTYQPLDVAANGISNSFGPVSIAGYTGTSTGISNLVSFTKVGGISGDLVGTSNIITESGSGNLSNAAYGTVNNISISGGTLANAYGSYQKIAPQTGTITNGYGVYVEPVTATNAYAIYTAGNTSSYFGGNVGIGSTTPSAKLSILGDMYLSGIKQVAVSSGPGTSAGTSTTFIGADGGDTTDNSVSTAGGKGGALSFSGGIGGSPFGANQFARGGVGGPILISGGKGGDTNFSTGQGLAGGGGPVDIQGGTGGGSAGPAGNFSGTGGAVTLRGGTGGISSMSWGNGGYTQILGGEGASGGSVFISGGGSWIGPNNVGNLYLGASSTLQAVGKIFFGVSGGVFDTNTSRLGLGTTSPWRTLSVSGSSDLGTDALAGSFTATSTTSTSTFAGSIRVGTNTPIEDNSAILLTRNLTGSLANGYHGLRDETAYNGSGGGLLGYASFDGIPVFSGSSSYNHLNVFQARPEYAGSGTINAINGMTFQPKLSGTGSASYTAGVQVYDALGTGVIGTQYGLFVNTLTRGSDNYAIYTNGSTKSYFGGNVGIGTTSPTNTLEVQGKNSVTGPAPYALAAYGGVSGSGSNGGGFYFQGGSSGLASGGGFTFFGGNSGDGVGGGFALTAGSGANPGSSGGSIALTAGAGGAFGSAGNITLTAGNAGASATGGNITLNPGLVNSTYGNVRLAPSGGNVGIGTSTPIGALTIYNASDSRISFSNGSALSYVGSGASFDVWNGQNTPIRFATNNAQQMILTAAGNLGIGTTTPGQKLSLWGSSTVLQEFGQGQTAFGYIGSGSSVFSGAAASDFAIYGNLHPVKIGGRAAADLTVDTTGNIGIGTTTPQKKLTISLGNSGVDMAGLGQGILLESNTHQYVMLESAANAQQGFIIGHPGSNAHAGLTWEDGTRGNVLNLFANGSGLTVANSGNVGIGTSTPQTATHIVENSSGKALRVDASATHTLQEFFNKDTFAFLGNITEQASPSRLRITAANALHLTSNSSNTNGILIDTSGNVGVGTTTPGALLTVYSGTSNSDLVQVRHGNQYIYQQSNTASGYGAIGVYDAVAGAKPLALQTAGGNVGIGTTSPYKKLSIADSSNTNTAQVVVQDSSSVAKGYIGNFANSFYLTSGGTYSNGWIGDSGSKPISSITLDSSTSGGSIINFGTAAVDNTGPSTRMSIIGNGNVGIGSTNPFAPLYIQNANQSKLVLHTVGTEANGDTAGLWFKSAANFADQYQKAAVVFMNNGTGFGRGDIRFLQNNSTSVNNVSTTSDTVMTITSGGNVGIGTTNPGYKLSVAGGALGAAITTTDWNGSNTGSVLNFANGANTGNTYGSIAALSAGGGAWNNLILQAGGGNVGIGTTSPDVAFQVNAGFPTVKISNAADPARYLQMGVDAATSNTFLDFTTGGVSSRYLDFRYGGSSKMVVTGTGNVGIGTTSPYATLAVNGGLAITDNNKFILGQYGGENSISYLTPGGTPSMVFTTAGSERARITNSGNLGIGTSTPGNRLDVQSGNVFTLGAKFSSVSNDTTLGNYPVMLLQNYGTTNNNGLGVRFLDGGGNSVKQIGTVNTDQAGSGYFYIGKTSAQMVVDNSGNVGIGTTDPTLNGTTASKFTVAQVAGGTALAIATSTTGRNFALNVGTAGGWTIYDGGSNGTVWTAGLSQLNGNVGIGTTAPNRKLDVTGNSTSIVLDPQSGIGYVGTYNNNDFALIANNSDKLHILASSGNVGIGTTAPNNKLSVNGDIGIPSYGATGSGFALDAYYQSGWKGAAAGYAGLITQGTGANNAINFKTSQYINAPGDAITWVDALSMLGNGNVGIGTTTPGTALDIGGTGGDLQFTAPTSGGTSGQLIATNKGLVLNAQGANIVGLVTNGAERMRVSPSGNIGIGTTNPNAQLHIATTSAVAGNQIRLETANSSQASTSIGFWSGSVNEVARIEGGYDSASNYGLRFSTYNSGLSEKMRISPSGNVGIGTTNPQAPLDIGGYGSLAYAGTGLAIKTNSSNMAGMELYNAGSGFSSIGLYNAANGGTGNLILAQGTASNVGTTLGLPNFGTAQISSSNNLVINTVAANPLVFGTSNTERMRIDSSGNVGIGTTTPTEKLEVAGNIRLSPGASRSITSAGGELLLRMTGDTLGDMNFRLQNRTGSNGAIFEDPNYDLVDFGFVGSSGAQQNIRFEHRGSELFNSGNTAGEFQIGTTGTNFNANLVIGSAASIFRNGNVGIGTTTPGSKLEVWGIANQTARLVTSANSGIVGVLQLESAANQAADRGVKQTFFVPNGGNVAGREGGEIAVANTYPSGGGAYMSLSTENTSGAITERMRIDHAGNVGIGTTTPGSRLDVWGGIVHVNNGAGRNLVVVSDGVVQGTSGIALGSFNDSMTAYAPLSLVGSSIVVSGNVGIATTSPYAQFSVGDTGTTNTGSFAIGSTSMPYTSSEGSTYYTKTLNSFTSNGSAVGPLTASMVVSNLNNKTALGQTIGFLSDIYDQSSNTTSHASLTGVKSVSTHANSASAGTYYAYTGLSQNLSGGYTTPGLSGSSITLTNGSGSVYGATTTAATGYAAVVQNNNSTGLISTTKYFEATNLNNTGTITNTYGFYAGDLTTGTQTNTPFSFYASDASAYNYFAGNVGIGTSTPTAQLSTTGTVRFSNFGAGTLQTDASGNITVSSDERLKDIHGGFTRGLSDILGLNPILYSWNDTSGLDKSTINAGFSAQNVQLHIPEAVNTDNHGYLTLSDRPILAATVNAIKELSLSINDIKGRLTNIEGRLAELENRIGSSTASNATTSEADTIHTVSSWLSSLGVVIENSVARFVSVVADTVTSHTVITNNLKVGDSSNYAAAGITILDRVTGQPYCMFIANGVMQNQAGACDNPNSPSNPGFTNVGGAVETPVASTTPSGSTSTTTSSTSTETQTSPATDTATSTDQTATSTAQTSTTGDSTATSTPAASTDTTPIVDLSTSTTTTATSTTP